MRLSWLDWTAFVLVIIGAINWLLVAFGMNLVTAIFGGVPALVTIIYVLVGLAGLYLIWYVTRASSERAY